MKYIKEIFKYIKTKIEPQIIILNTETYYKPQNLQIIKEIKNELNVSLEYILIIFNIVDFPEFDTPINGIYIFIDKFFKNSYVII